MLDQFYSYLSDKVISYFKHNTLKGGDKFYIQFELEEQVNKLYDTLKNNTIAQPFLYEDHERGVEYSTYMLEFGSAKLIVASTGDKTHPDFLTNLRNLVGVESTYEDKAILFIHNTTLDSLIGGTASFHKEGMPFHINEIEKDIKQKLNESGFSEVDKKIIEMTLRNKKSTLVGNNVSVFEYEDLLSVINQTGIETQEYPEFGLFPDPDLYKYSGKELRNRLDDNAKNFARVDEFHSYGLNENYLERFYDEKGVDKLKGSEWKNIKYGEVEKAIEDKKDRSVIEFIECKGAWDREDGTTKAKSRKRNIIAFKKEESVSFELTFSEHISKNGLDCKDDHVQCTASGKRIKIQITPEKKCEFFVVKYEQNKVKFEFKILVVDVEEKYLESIKAKYLIHVAKKDYYLLINSNESDIILNEFSSIQAVAEINQKQQSIEMINDERLVIRVGAQYEFENEMELARFIVNINGCEIPFGKMETKEKPTVIDGLKVWKMKKDNEHHFYVTGENKLRHGTKEFYTRDEYRKNLDYEKAFIEQDALSLIERFDEIEEAELQVSQEVKEAFRNILNYFRTNNVLPSLAYIDEELVALYETFIQVFVENLDRIQSGEYLSKAQKDLFYIGMLKREIEDKEILLSPLHPINIAYQLEVVKYDLRNVEQYDVIKKLQSIYLLPYITFEPGVEEEKLYIPVEQNHSPEWKYYVDAELPRYKGSKDFVAKLVSEKIEEFVEHFSTLFTLGSKAPIKINLVHTGDSREILQGIFKYYVKRLREGKDKAIQPMEIFIYSEENVTNSFDEFASIDNYEELIELFDLELKVEDMTPEEVIDVYREKVSFYVKDINKDMQYAHLTFLEMNEENKIITTDMKDIHSGVILNGAISGTPSIFLGDSYRTGFGTKFANVDSNIMKVAIKLNAIDSAMTGDKFDPENCKAISIAKKSQTVLSKIYDASHWVTFIDPKVDLNFFKNDPNSKELLIIHYSDQYTTSGGYDAITVTRKSQQYQEVIEDFLADHHVVDGKNKSAEVINMFNAINGDWLLRLISSRSHFPKEKISILSAFKVALSKFRADNLIWVPISLEEILRVSGGVGLKQSSGFFSAKNLNFYNNNSMSDDLLMIGIKEVEGKVQVAFYPVEVKIGANTSQYVQKGIEQAARTRKLIYESLNGDNCEEFVRTIYRNFFMQLVVTSAEKLCLYEVGDESLGWERVIDSKLRGKLLNEQYEIVDSISDEMQQAAVISFKKSCSAYSDFVEQNVLILELSERAGVNLLTKDINSINIEDFSNSEFYESEESACFETVEEEVASTVSVLPVKVSEEPKAQEESKEQEELEAEAEDITLAAEENEAEQYGAQVNTSNSDKQERHMKILFGENIRTHKELYWYPTDSNKVSHPNTGIIGTMGTGKTQFTKSIITQIYREMGYNVDGKDIGILIFDYKGDYNKSKKDFVDATNANVYELYHLPYNPLALTLTDNPKPLLPLHTANSLKDTISKAFNLGPKQQNILRECIMDAYEFKGIRKSEASTWTLPAPTLNDVYKMYINREDFKEDSLFAAFKVLIDFEIFETDSTITKGLFDLVQGVTVIDLSGFDSEIQNLVVAITLDLFYSQMQVYGHSKIDGDMRQLSKIILVDEADNFLSKNFASLKKILKEGREFGVGTILSTQLLSHFSTGDNEYADYILTWVIHSVSDLGAKDIKYLFNTKGKQEEEYMYSKIKELKKHYSIVKMGGCNEPIYIRDKAFWELVK